MLLKFPAPREDHASTDEILAMLDLPADGLGQDSIHLQAGETKADRHAYHLRKGREVEALRRRATFKVLAYLEGGRA